ncbi:nodulation protein NfeD, partial [bacterium]|nr:nodulation protein NfeD [bacterium]
MKVFSWFLASICIFQALLGATLWADESSGPRRVYVAQMRGSINPAGAAYLSRVIRLADEDPQAEAVLIELDTPGGLLSSTRSIIQSIAKSRRPVLIFVSPSGASATSAGAILMLSAHGSGMAPGTNIGAAHPVGSKGENIGGDMKEKVVNDTVALVKSVAQERRRPVEAAEKMVRSSSS